MTTENRAELKHTLILSQAFDKILEKRYNQFRAPEPYITPTGISPLDGLLGGGILSSGKLNC